MSWCPKCKIEYRDDIIVCADCGTELVKEQEETSPLTRILEFDKEELAQKFLDFLHYSNLKTAEMDFDPEKENWYISVENDAVSEGVKLFKAFELAENDNDESKETQKQQREESMNSSVYVKKEEKYTDLKSSASTFFFVGILGLIFLILNLVGVINLFNSPIQMGVMGVLFIGFIYFGFDSYAKAKVIKLQIGGENTTTNSIKNWMVENITRNKLDEMSDSQLSEEANYIHITDKIKVLLLENFGEMDDSYMDHIIEEFYNENFE